MSSETLSVITLSSVSVDLPCITKHTIFKHPYSYIHTYIFIELAIAM